MGASGSRAIEDSSVNTTADGLSEIDIKDSTQPPTFSGMSRTWTKERERLENVEVVQSMRVEDSAASYFAFDPPIRKRLGPPLIIAEDVVRSFHLEKIQSKSSKKWLTSLKKQANEENSAPEDSERIIYALKRLSLSLNSETYPIREGEFVIIRGPSGGGKTTALNLLGALDRPSSGSLLILGNQINSRDLTERRISDLRLRHIGFVFQTFNLLGAMSAVENVELPMILLGELSPTERKIRAIELLAKVGLGDRLHHLPGELSGGEQQRVAIARALSNRPEILLLDEPTGDLDTFSTIEVMRLLLKENLENRTTCVMVTHNPDLECYADRILYIRNGRIERQALNYEQIELSYEQYSQLLERREDTALGREYGNAG